MDTGVDFPNLNWNWSLVQTTEPPYNLSSTIPNAGFGQLKVETSMSCVHSSEWSFSMYSGVFNGTDFPNPRVELQFDASTANMTVQGYAEASPIYGTGASATLGDTVTWGQFRLTLSAVIDTYHSDILRNDTGTPT